MDITTLVSRVGGGGRTHAIHGRSRVTIDPSAPAYNAGTEQVGISPTRQTLLVPSAKHREVLDELLKGELHPAKNRL